MVEHRVFVVVEVVALGPEDWEQSRDVRLRSLLDAPDAFWMTHAEEVDRDPSAWQEMLSRDTSVTLHAMQDGRAVGCAVAAVHHEDPGVGALYAMWVEPDARGSGAADALVEAVLAWARARSFPVVRLDVADDNEPAKRLYARHGAVPTGRGGPFPPPRDHITEHELEIAL